MAKKYYDKGMISESKNEFANMPQDVKHVSYPKSNYDCDGPYRDTLSGIDAFARENSGKVKKQMRMPSDS